VGDKCSKQINPEKECGDTVCEREVDPRADIQESTAEPGIHHPESEVR
jgi:hypothetical protein